MDNLIHNVIRRVLYLKIFALSTIFVDIYSYKIYTVDKIEVFMVTCEQLGGLLATAGRLS